MQFIKLFLKIFIGVPLTIILVIMIAQALTESRVLDAAEYAFYLIIFFGICILDTRRSNNRILNSLKSRGINIDFIVSYVGGGVVIDLANEQILVGNLLTATPVKFSEVVRVECENAVVFDKCKYNLFVNTNNFHSPRVGAGFAGDRASRDLAFAKLNAALKFN